jgi:hypothetical protein
MPDAFTTITKLINSPPGQLAAGGALAGIVWKFFERVESVLNKAWLWPKLGDEAKC